MNKEIILWAFVSFMGGIAFTLYLKKLDEYLEKRNKFELILNKLNKFLQKSEKLK